jgi:phosphate transport system protein
LTNLRGDLQHLGDSVEQALTRSIHGLQHSDTAVARWVMSHDSEIDDLRRVVEERVILLLATQQPIVAHDLRLLAVVSAIATELERIADYANAIARRTCRIVERGQQPNLPPGIDEMIDLTRQMLRTSLQALFDEDEDLARGMAETDDRVDELETALRETLIARLPENPDYTHTLLDMLDVVHALERAADRATNIGERVIYLVTNNLEELNP